MKANSYFGIFIFIFYFIFFFCVCNVNFCIPWCKTLSQYPWLVLFRSYKASIILQLITVSGIKVCSETPFRKKIVWSQPMDLPSNQFTICASFYWKVQVFFKGLLIFKKQSNIDSLKISYHLTLSFRLNSFMWKTLCWAECYVYFNCLLVLTNCLGY